MTGTYDRRLGPHHFAYLRSVAEGLPREDAARRYLGMIHGHELVTLHRQLVDQLRSLARRAGDSRWRLIGLELGTRSAAPQEAQQPPSLHDWAESEGLGDWSHAELLEMYQQRFPPKDKDAARRARRSARLRERQLDVLATLEPLASKPAQPSDRIDAWFDPVTADRLHASGCLLLQDLAQRIASRKNWWSGIRAVGATKALRIEAHLRTLLPAAAAGPDLANPGIPIPATSELLSRPRHDPALDGSQGSNRSPLPPRVPANNDIEAIDLWLASAVGQRGEPGHNAITESTYRREAERWLMFCLIERHQAMSSATPEDCRAYMAFLNNVPTHWMSRRRAARLDVAGGWTPFRGQPGLASRRLAVKVLHLMCNWLTAQRYLDSNPWIAVNRSLVDGNDVAPPPSSRALSPAAYQALLSALPHPDRPGETRNGFVVAFTRFTGLRASELLNARIGDLRQEDFGWQLDVIGKGRKRRRVSLPSPAMQVLLQHLTARGHPVLETCPPDFPLLGRLDQPELVPTYGAVHQALSRFMKQAFVAADMPERERERALPATQHWLRHTFATRAAEAGVPEDVLMAEMGHASRATTAGYYTAQDRRRSIEMERASSA